MNAARMEEQLTGPDLLVHLLSDHGVSVERQVINHPERLAELHAELHTDALDHEH